MRHFYLPALAGLLALPLAAHADLLGDSVHVVYEYPTQLDTYADLGNVTVPGSGALPFVGFSISANQITITNPFQQTYNSSPFNGFVFTDVTTDPGITNVTIDPASTFLGADVTFSSNQVVVNLQGLDPAAGATLLLDLSFPNPSSVTPEPSSFALLGTGLLGVAGTMRRRFVRA